MTGQSPGSGFKQLPCIETFDTTQLLISKKYLIIKIVITIIILYFIIIIIKNMINN